MFDIGFPRDWSSLKKLIWLKAAISGGGASAVWKTVTGTLIHITNALASPMRKCEVTLEPIQDLHGQDAPYPAGGSSNIWDEEWEIGLVDASSGQNTPNNNYSRTKNYIPVDADTSYYLVFPSGVTLYLRFYDAEKNYLGYSQKNSAAAITPSQVSASFATAAYLRFCWDGQIYNNNIAINYPSTDHSYHPYSNICPITGWTGADVNVDGKNILPNNYSAYSIDAAYAFIPAIMPKNVNAIMSFKDKDTSVDVSNCSMGFVLEREPNESVSDIRWCMQNGNVKNVTNNSSSNHPNILCNGIIIFPRSEGAFNKIFARWDIQVEYGDTKTDYEPYSGTTASVTFPDTVYGGSYEFVSGGLKSGYKKFVVDENTSISYSSSAKGFYVNGGWNDALYTQNTETGRAALAQAVFCDTLKYDGNIVFGQYGFRFTYYMDGWAPLIFVPSVTSKAEAQAWLADNNVTFLYPIANPVEIQLTPQEISTLAGENNIWSDAQSMTVTYKADGRASDVEALNMLLGGTYQNQGNPDDVTDKEALQILLGDKS